jgi:D-3-phosphoglycerate dehydrogenase / 2-oxoglutarate reductase
MRVLVSDNLGEEGVAMFRDAAGIEVDVRTGLKPDQLKEIIGEYEGLVIRSATNVTEDLISAAPRLKVVGRAGIGLDNVDIPAATKRGIVVMNTPGGNVVTTAEHAIAMMLSLTRNIPQATASLKAGKWEKKKLQGRELFNKVLGVIGFGKIGTIVADRARGLKMQVVIYDPFVSPEQIEKAGYQSATLEALYQQSDYITVHVPKLKNTAGMLNKAAFDQMKNGVMLINCARGGIINETDLYDAIKSGKVGGAALDVFETEPPGDHPLFSLDQVIATPHLGASTKEAQTNVAVAVADQIIDFLQNGTIRNAVNVPSVTGELLEKLGPYLYLGGRIGSLAAQLINGPLTEVHIDYKGDFHGLDLSPVTCAVLKGLLTPMVKDDVNFVNAGVIAKERGIKVAEGTTAASDDYNNLISVRVVSTETSCSVVGTIFGKGDARIVMINNFRLELIPEGHLGLIHNKDIPGSIGEIGTLLGKHQINIGRMHVGQEKDGERNIIYLQVDTPLTVEVVEALRALNTVKKVIALEFS